MFDSDREFVPPRSDSESSVTEVVTSDNQHVKSMATWVGLAAQAVKKQCFEKIDSVSDFVQLSDPEQPCPSHEIPVISLDDTDSDHKSTAFHQRIIPLKEYLDAEEKKAAKERLSLLPELDDEAMDLLLTMDSGFLELII